MLLIQNVQLDYQHKKDDIVDHPNGRSYGILMQFTSQARVLTENGLEDVRPGDCMLSFHHTPAYIAPAEQQNKGFSNSYLVFDDHQSFLEASVQYHVPHHRIIHETDFSTVNSLFDQIYIEKALARPMHLEQIDLLLRQLLLHLGRSADQEETPALPSRNRLLISTLQKIRQELYLNPNVYLTVQSMADAANISSGYLRSLYKTLFGITPKQDILLAKIERSKSLLTLTDKPMSQIAALCGFEDENYFARCFRNQMHTTPSDYRKQNAYQDL